MDGPHHDTPSVERGVLSSSPNNIEPKQDGDEIDDPVALRQEGLEQDESFGIDQISLRQTPLQVSD